MLQDHDVHVTDWHHVRDVPPAAGRFGLDEYTQHLLDFLATMGPNANVIAVCQPCVAALAAVALMSEDQHPATQASLTLMAGPIDCRVSPTAVNKLAVTKPIAWFEQNLISRVPARHGGAGRRVYPGFVQLAAFISMNKARHADAFKTYDQHLVDGEFEQAKITRTFYEEFLAVADLSADFYLETVKKVFQDHALPKGELLFRGRKINPAAIRRTALLTAAVPAALRVGSVAVPRSAAWPRTGPRREPVQNASHETPPPGPVLGRCRAGLGQPGRSRPNRSAAARPTGIRAARRQAAAPADEPGRNPRQRHHAG